MPRVATVLMCVLILCHTTLAAHYRGSMMTWRVLNSTNTSVLVELLQRHVWHYYFAMCNTTQIAAGNYNVGSGNLICAAPCPLNVTVLASVTGPCVDINIPENYTISEGRRQVRLPANQSTVGVFEGSSWFSLVQGGGNWSVAVQINTFKRSDGRYNHAPIITMLPVIRLKRNLTYNIHINVADNDFDPYQCLWSTTLLECSGICMQVPASTVLNSTTCMLKFRPTSIGYYAIALTVVDYETTTSTIQLSRVPVQFLFKVWDSNNSCQLPPLYLGEVPADQCIYIEPNEVHTVRVLIRIQCPNATLDNVITSYPSGFTRSATYFDQFDPRINIFFINYTAQIQQLGQNLFCFAGVDSIGNQADTTCLRFTVQQGTSSMNTLYINNATRYPTNTVSKSQSNWTLIYPSGVTFARPQVTTYIRFKLVSTQQDFLTIDVVRSTNVNYLSDRLTFTSSVIFTPGQSFYISFDPGVFLPTSTCFRDSMGITDPTFWTFDIPPDPNTTATAASTTTTTQSTTLRSRTVTSLPYSLFT